MDQPVLYRLEEPFGACSIISSSQVGKQKSTRDHCCKICRSLSCLVTTPKAEICYLKPSVVKYGPACTVPSQGAIWCLFDQRL